MARGTGGWLGFGQGEELHRVPGPEGRSGRELPVSGGWAALVADIFHGT